MKTFFIKLLLFSAIFSQCDENYVENPLFSEGDDDYAQCIPEEFVFYISTTFSAYMFNVVLINDNEISSEDWVGAFKDSNNDGVGDICVGSRKWNIENCGDSTCDVLVRGDDGSDLTDGYMSFGEYPYFKIFDASTGEYLSATPQENITFGNLGANVIGYLQACSGGSMDLDNDNICNDVDLCYGDNSTLDPDSDGVCSNIDVCDTSLDWDYPNIINQIDCEIEIDTNGDGINDTDGVWDLLTNTCGDGICDSLDDCVGNNWNNGSCEPLESEGPITFSLKQNYPNPFNPYTTIEFTLKENDYIDLIIYDLNGKKVRHLVKEYLLSGVHTIRWDGKNDEALPMPSSNYIVYLKNSKEAYHNKLTMIK